MAQSTVFSRYLEEVLDDDEQSSVNVEEFAEQMAELSEHPMDLNTVTKEQLEMIPFLPFNVMEEIIFYRDMKPFASVDELLLVRHMNNVLFQLLTEVVFVNSPEQKEYTPNLKKMFQQGHHELSTRFDLPLYTREGYKIHSAEVLEKNPNKQYLGNALYHNLRYRFHYGRRMEIGLTAEKDAGEPFFNSVNKKGYDFYSPYFILRNYHKINTLALGNYKLNYGYGLVMNSGFNMGKTAVADALQFSTEGITKHSSTNEYLYFQGAAASVRWAKRWITDAFYSYRTMDATTDSLWITTLKTDGYHRLQREVEKKNKVVNQVIGSNIRYIGKNVRVGLTGVYHVFNRELKPTLTGYRRFAMHGREFWNVGLNYKWMSERFTFYGETAVDHLGALATLNTLVYSPHWNQRLILMNRYYDARYQSLYAQSLSEGGSVQNESAVYLGLETNVLRQVHLNAFVDYFYFPWKKYRLSKAGTTGWDGWMQLSYQPTSQLDMWIRYRYRNKYRDLTDTTLGTLTLPYIQHKFYATCQWKPSGVWRFRLKTNYGQVHYQDRSVSQGCLVSVETTCQSSALPFQAALTLTGFCTDDYDSRQSTYEKNLLYAFSSTSFYGQGMRASLVIRWDINTHWMMQGKIGSTHYFDRSSIGTGLDLMDGDTKTDLGMLVRVKY